MAGGKIRRKKKRGRRHDAQSKGQQESIQYDEDDGSISAADCKELSRLIYCGPTRPFEKTTTEFLEHFTNRSFLTIGYALQTYYDVLHSIDTKDNKLILKYRLTIIYLLFRSSELEPCLKREDRNQNSMIGHPFAEFFLSLVPSSFQKGTVNKWESLLSFWILSDYDLNPEMSPDDFVKQTPTESVGSAQKALYEEVEKHVLSCCVGWPTIHECDTEFSGLVPVELTDTPQTPAAFNPHLLTEEALCQLGVGILCDDRPPTTVSLSANLMPQMCPITENEIMHNYDDEKRSSKNDGPGAEGNAPNMDQLKLCVEKVLREMVLSPLEQKILIWFITTSDLDGTLMRILIDVPPTILPLLIEKNFKVALVLAKRGISADKSRINRYMNVLLGMEVSVHCMELVRQLYDEIPGLDKSLLVEYVQYAMHFCEREGVSPSQQSRHIRLVCMFLTTLIKLNVLEVKELFTGMQQFVVKFNQHKESALLYQVLVEANRRETGD